MIRSLFRRIVRQTTEVDYSMTGQKRLRIIIFCNYLKTAANTVENGGESPNRFEGSSLSRASDTGMNKKGECNSCFILNVSMTCALEAERGTTKQKL